MCSNDQLARDGDERMSPGGNQRNLALTAAESYLNRYENAERYFISPSQEHGIAIQAARTIFDFGPA